MKNIAFYLPQFHAIPENDEWWGMGFTEWENVKKSRAQFRGHKQPEIPLDNNYYCLLDEKVQEKQSELALKYGVDGFCYYHYWFEGKLLLEKPMENMLYNKNIKIPFCVCWANETWARTWDGDERKVLIKQNYCEGEEGWSNHFKYMLPFFADERYIRVNGKPMFIVYKPYLIENFNGFMKCWNQLAIESGLSGIYWGFQHHTSFEHLKNLASFDFGIEFEPFYTVFEMNNHGYKETLVSKVKKKILGLPTIYSYDDIWKRMIERKPINFTIYPGAFTSWDNTPRRGSKSIVFYESTPEKFKEYFKRRIEYAQKYYDSSFIFINAWNEWAEGAHLEPDEYNRYGYLEALNNTLKELN